MPLDSANPTKVNYLVRHVTPLRLLYRNRSADVVIHSCCIIDTIDVSVYGWPCESVP